MAGNVTELFPEIKFIQNDTLKSKVITVWDEALGMSNWENPLLIPFNSEIGAEPSLINHTRSVTRTALWYAENYEKTFNKQVDHDVLIAGAILHDVSKVLEFELESDGPVKTEIGKNFPHGTFSGFLSWKTNLPIEVLHLIVTHSPAVHMLPNSIEGYILKYADLMDADAHYFSAGLTTIMKRYK